MDTTVIAHLALLASAFLFVSGIKQLSSPATARSGNARAALAMLVAVVVTVLQNEILSWPIVAASVVAGALAGSFLARTIKMTAMPQLVAVFNGFGGGASAAVAGAEFLRVAGGGTTLPAAEGATIVLGTLIGAVTLSGSFIAYGKLQGIVTGNPVVFPLQKTANAVLFLGILVAGAALTVGDPTPEMYFALAGAALLLGVLLVIPIGGADMPVVVSLLNSYSGLAAAATGFALGNMILIIAGRLGRRFGPDPDPDHVQGHEPLPGQRGVRSVRGGGAQGEAQDRGAPVRDVDAEQAAMILAYASSVAVVPGYGLAVAQAQHELKKVCDMLQERGVTVRFGIHPVAGRMPGHMNVLLAEADVSYDQLLDLDEINPEFGSTDVVLVVGANDVVNPAARDPDSVIAGMPILDVDRARSVIVMKRSLSAGFAGIDNDLFYMDKHDDVLRRRQAGDVGLGAGGARGLIRSAHLPVSLGASRAKPRT